VGRTASYDRLVLRPTGERVIPAEQREELVYAEHLARYRFAAQFAPGRRVLDAGSGEGYGTALLNDAGAASVIGLDVDDESVRHARKQYGIEFVHGDIATLPFPDDSFDLVVCFETIEHVGDPAAALGEFRRVLVDDGLLIISTPNRDEYLVENEFHELEYSPEEFDALLGTHFPRRTRLYQQNWLLSAILDEGQLPLDDGKGALKLELSKLFPLSPGKELYSVVVCGAPVQDPPRSVGAITGVFEAQRLAEELRGCVEQLRGWQGRATKAERQRQAWEKRATVAEQQRESWEKRAHEAERQVGETRQQLEQAEYALERLVSSLSWRLTKPLRSARALLRRQH
jgi:SAM-dependent methyltransferase